MLREFAAYYRPHMRLFWVDFGCAVLSGLLELAFPLAIVGFIDVLLPRGARLAVEPETLVVGVALAPAVMKPCCWRAMLAS